MLVSFFIYLEFFFPLCHIVYASRIHSLSFCSSSLCLRFYTFSYVLHWLTCNICSMRPAILVLRTRRLEWPLEV